MRDGFITINDSHYDFDGQPAENGEVTTTCRIGKDNGIIRIEYNESFESEFDASTVIMVEEKRVTMLRSGFINTSMVFENGCRHTCCYDTPVGQILIGVYTNAMYVSMSENGGEIHLAFTVDSGGDFLSKNELKITAEIKEDLNVGNS